MKTILVVGSILLAFAAVAFAPSASAAGCVENRTGDKVGLCGDCWGAGFQDTWCAGLGNGGMGYCHDDGGIGDLLCFQLAP